MGAAGWGSAVHRQRFPGTVSLIGEHVSAAQAGNRCAFVVDDVHALVAVVYAPMVRAQVLDSDACTAVFTSAGTDCFAHD